MSKRILLIDDENGARQITQFGLEAVAGWIVLTASCGTEGLALADSENPDAILLDMMMPDMDGTMVIQHLRQNPKTQDIPVIFLTAKAFSLDPNYLKEMGVMGIIIKPFKIRLLVGSICSHLGWDVPS